MNNQCEMVIQYIKDFGSITSREAFTDLGIARLASRIYDLTQIGYEFDKETETSLNRYGDPTHYARYSLRKQPESA